MESLFRNITRLAINLLTAFGFFPWLARVLFGQRIAAVMALTWKAAFRFRLFIVIVVLLLAAVVLLPVMIKDDGTARGFTQILLTYTLSTITGLLGLSTLWLACGTLARDIEECQIQMVAVKPIARWQIWLGKWLGLMSLNAALLAISGLSVFLLLQWRATGLPEKEQRILRNEVLVARASAKPPTLVNEIEAETDNELKRMLEKSPVPAAEIPPLRQAIKDNLTAYVQNVPPGNPRTWKINLGLARNFIREQPLFLRVKFNTSLNNSGNLTFPVLWAVGVPRETKYWETPEPMSLAPETFHEFEIPAGLFDEQGVLTVTVANPNNIALLFTMEDGIEVLYREGGFALNFARGLGIIFCWMALLATLGLAAASFLSFPVAAFVAIAALLVVFSSGTLATVVTDGTIMSYNQETGTRGSPLDGIAVPLFKGILTVINLAKDFSPIDQLSAGRSITWWELLRAVSQIIGVLGGILSAFGIWAFTRRELATAQNQS